MDAPMEFVVKVQPVKTVKIQKSVVLNQTNKDRICDRCGEEYENMTSCHLICKNCGWQLDCSDKGTAW